MKCIGHLGAVFRAALLVMFVQGAMAQYRNVQVIGNATTIIQPEEATIAVNPAEPEHILAGSNLDFYYYSTNGGATWVAGHVFSTYGNDGDPCVIVGTNSDYYYFHLTTSLSRIACQKLTALDGDWSGGTFTGLNGTKSQDKPWAAIDPGNNRIYVTWTQFDVYENSDPTNQTLIRFSASSDGGQTWSDPVRLNQIPGDCTDSSGTVEGAMPTVGPQGEVYVSWAGPVGIMFTRSLDGGLTWLDSEVKVSDQPGGWDLRIPGVSRCNGLPVIGCDRSAGPHRGTIYVNWSDQRNGVTNTDIWISKSTDEGNTWSAPKRVNDDDSQHNQFFPWMAVDPTDGTIYIVFYDRRNYNWSLNLTDVYLAVSRDGGETFANTCISQSPFDLPRTGAFIGDYINVSAINGIVRPIWTRFDGGTSTSIWTALINPPPVIAKTDLRNGNLELSLANLTAYLTNYVERSSDLRSPTNWTVVNTFSGLAGTTNWIVSVDQMRPAVFYRVRSY